MEPTLDDEGEERNQALDQPALIDENTIDNETAQVQLLSISQLHIDKQGPLMMLIERTVGIILKLYKVLLSGIWIPSNIKNSPLNILIIGLSSLILLLLTAIIPSTIGYLMVGCIAFMLGFIYALPELSANPTSTTDPRTLNLLLPISFREDANSLSKLRSPSTNSTNPEAPDSNTVKISPLVDAKLDKLLTRLVSSIIDPWYQQVNKSGNREFQSCVRTSLNTAMLNCFKIFSGHTKDALTVFVYGITKALQIHMQEFREFEKLGYSNAESFLISTNRRPFYRTMQEEIEHLKQISALLLKRLLPRQESRSINLNALLKEVLASNLFWNLIDRISDPDFINMEIVKRFQDVDEMVINVQPGWNIIVIKVLKGENMPSDDPTTSGICCMLHIAGRKVKTRRLRNTTQPTWNEVFQFKVSDAVLENLKVVIQLLQYSSSGHYISFGFVKLDQDFSEPSIPRQTWLKFLSGKRMSDGKHPEVFVEYSLHRPQKPVDALAEEEEEENDDLFNQSFPKSSSHYQSNGRSNPMEPPNSTTAKILPPTVPSIVNEPPLEKNIITLDVALQNNDLFMEFYEFLNANKAPPYLQFLMNVDGSRQIAATELRVDPKDPAAVDNFFRKGPLTSTQLEKLKVLHHEAQQIFNAHFIDSSKYRIELDPPVLEELKQALTDSAKLTEDLIFIGKAVGPNVFIPAYKYVLSVLEEVYFPKFKQSPAYARVMDRARFTTLNFTLDDDKFSTYSTDSVPYAFSQGPSYPHSTTSRTAPSHDEEGNLELLEEERDGQHLPIQSQLQSICDDPETEIKQISTAIASLRQQVALIEDKLETLPTDEHVEDLVKSKKEKQAQIKGLVSLIESKDRESLGEVEDFWLDLRNVTIHIKRAEVSTSGANNGEGGYGSGMVSALFSTTAEPIFDIQVNRQLIDNEEESSRSLDKRPFITLSVVSRAYSDFEKLRKVLKRGFPRITKLPFPSITSKSLTEQLESFLSLLVSDQFISQTIELREFLTLDGNFEETKSAAGQFVEAVVGKAVKNAFKSATSVFSSPSTHSTDTRTKFYEARERNTTSEISRPVEASAIGSTPQIIKRSSSSYSLYDSISSVHDQHKKSEEPLFLPPIQEGKQPSSLPGQKVLLYKIDEFSDSEVEMMIELVFDFVSEAFDLQEPNQWFRRKLFGVFKQVLKQAYGDTLSKAASDSLNRCFEEENVLYMLQLLTNVLWEDGIFIKDRPPPIRSEEQKLATAIEARTLFLKKAPPLLHNFAGRYNAICGMTRIFNMFQHQEFNRLLLMTILDIMVKVMFTDQVK